MQRKNLKIFLIVGTRPEFIKMYPVYKKLWEISEDNKLGVKLDIQWISSAQHKELLTDLYKFFKIKADHEFNIENKNLSLGQLHALIMSEATKLFKEDRPDLVIVQGDTLTCEVAGLAAFYEKILVAHIEAGLRTNNIYSPFPEELSRRVISQFATLNFTSSKVALNTLEAEKILYKKQSYNFYTGNTVVDVLEYTCNKILEPNFPWQEFAKTQLAFEDGDFNLYEHLENNPRKFFILITAHRRESGGEAFENLARAILRVFEKEDDGTLEFIISVHKSPSSREAFEKLHQICKERNIERIRFFEGINYPLFMKLMQHSYFIVTDSGGIQEEAPYLSKPVLIFRNETERVEGVGEGLAKLIGTDEHVVHGAMLELLTKPDEYVSMIKDGLQPYGDGLAAQRIVDVCMLYLKQTLGL